MRYLVAGLVAVLIFAFGGQAAAHPPGSDVLIRRTAHGVPHILATGFRDLGYGAGYAFAQDNLCTLADVIVTVSAQRSRWFGPDAVGVYGANNLAGDLYHQQVNQSGIIESGLARPQPQGPSAEVRELVRGYAAGYNRFLAERGVAGLPDARCRGAAWVRPITEIDLWRRMYQVATLSGGEALQEVVAAAQPPGFPNGAARLPRQEAGLGSNAVAIGRSATTGRTGMLLANPHFPWFGDRRFYQQHLTIPGVLNVSGMSLYGLPVVNIGHTDRMAWTHTVSTASTFTITRLALAPGDPTSYLVDGRTSPMARREVSVTVLRPDGSLGIVTQTMYSTQDGPVIEAQGFLDWTDTTAFALRDANFGNLRLLDQWLSINRAQSVGQVRAALVRHQGAPWINTVASDANGAAFYADIQVVPHVTDSLLARCGVDTGEPALIMLDGSRGSCGWGTDADAIEPGLLAPRRLPSLTRTDYVTNSNDSPWLANAEAPLTGYPAIVGDIGTERSLRTRLGLEMVADRRFSLEALQATMFGNRNLSAELGRDAVVRMCRANPTLLAGDGTPVDVREACRVLSDWDTRGDLASQGAFLWRTFIGLVRVDPWLVPFDPADPVRTPRGFNADQAGVRSALADAVKSLGAAGIPVDVPLGEVQQYRGIPIHGCQHLEGCFNVVEQAGQSPEVLFGASFIMATELTGAGPRTRTILTYGQSENPESPFHLDQARLFSAKQWVPERYTEADIARDPALTVIRLRFSP